MSSLVSKVRAKKTKTREKQASKASAEVLPLRERPIIGVIIATALWLTSIVLIGIEPLLQLSLEPAAILPLLGQAFLLLAGLFAAARALQIVEPASLKKNSRILLLALISLLSLVIVKGILYINLRFDVLPDYTLIYFIPLCSAPILTTILVGSRVAIVTGCFASLSIALLLGNSFPVLFMAIVISAVSAQLTDKVKTRTKIVRIGLLAGLCKVIFVAAAAAANWQTADISIAMHQSLAGLAGGLASAITAIIVLPLFERPFKITTNISLLELADQSHPLLQRLAIEAPGTYHHSLVVANLAQAAADEINANALLTRICAYFHDVGKLTKPDFFAENIQLDENPHDNLPPSMSTLVITAHVKEGVSLAVLHKLPPPVLNVIREHHGTSLLSFFHHKAKSQLEFELGQAEDATQNGQTKLDEGDFRYPGPKPSSPESAIICLADPVEAASRTIKKNTPGHIEGMVNDIVMKRLADGQLDDCTLTLAELTKIKRSFVFTLTNMLHARVPYPENEDRDKQQAKAAPSEQPANKGPDTRSDAESKET